MVVTSEHTEMDMRGLSLCCNGDHLCRTALPGCTGGFKAGVTEAQQLAVV